MDGLKDDLVSAMKEALEELDRRQLRRFEEFLRCVLGKGAQCSAENIGETSKVQERASVEEQRIVDGSTGLWERGGTDSGACVRVHDDGERECEVAPSPLVESCAVGESTEKTSTPSQQGLESEKEQPKIHSATSAQRLFIVSAETSQGNFPSQVTDCNSRDWLLCTPVTTVANKASTPMSEPADGSLSEVMTEHQQDACGSGEPVKAQLLSQPAPLSYEPFVQKLLPYTRCNDFLLDPRGECMYVRSPGEEHAEATQLNKLYVDDCSKLRNFLARRTVHFSSSVNSALMHDSDNHPTEDTVALGADGSRMNDWQDHANGLKNVRRAQKRELQAADIDTNVPTVDSTSSVAYGKVARHRKERPLRVTVPSMRAFSNCGLLIRH